MKKRLNYVKIITDEQRMRKSGLFGFTHYFFAFKQRVFVSIRGLPRHLTVANFSKAEMAATLP